MKKKTMSKEEYAQLTGLLTLARQHCDALDNIHGMALRITGEAQTTGGNSNTADWVYSGVVDVRPLIRRLGITVKDAEKIDQTL